MNLVNTGSTFETIIGDDYDDKKGFQEIKVNSNRSSALVNGAEDSITDEDLLSQIKDRQSEEKKILRTLDRHMMPLFCVFYFVDFLDRANIGNATLGGITEHLQLTPKQLSTSISAFYITYILFEVPSNIVLKRTSAVAWLSFIMLIWGVMTLVMAFAKNFTSLLACRLLLGAAESGYIPGILYLMSKVYRPREFGLRVALLLCMSSISGIVSGPIAYGTAFLEGQQGLHGWQYLFILEGVPTICLSVISYFYLFDDIQQVSWLTSAQKLLHKQYSESPSEEGSVTLKSFIRACFNWKTCMFSLVFFLNAVNAVSYQIFTPTIIDGFGFPVLTSQLLSAPPNVIQTIMIIVGGYSADKFINRRGFIIAAAFSTAALGFMLLLVLENRWGRYGALFLVGGGLGLQAPITVSWSAINFPKLELRVIAVAVVVMIGNSGGIVSSYLYPLSDKPHYYFGNIFNLSCSVLGAISAALTSYLLYRHNMKKDAVLEQYGSKETGSIITEQEEGEDEKINFRYYY